MKFYYCLIILFLFNSCGFIARKGYGAKKPKTENRESIEGWLKERSLSTETLASVVPDDYTDFAFGLPQAPLLFDNATGNFVAVGFTNGKYCPTDIDKSFASILPYNLLKEKPDSFLISEITTISAGVSKKENDTLHLQMSKIKQSLRTLDGKAFADISDPAYDYTLLIPFAVFLGKRLQVKDLKKIYFSVMQNRFSKIKITFLNLDKQEWWGEEWNKKINITL